MPPPKFKARGSDVLASRLEDLFLTAPPSELKAASRKPGAVDLVRSIIGEQLAQAEGSRAGGARQASGQGANPALLGRDAASSAPARAVFGKGKTSAQDKVEELISSLTSDRKNAKSAKSAKK